MLLEPFQYAAEVHVMFVLSFTLNDKIIGDILASSEPVSISSIAFWNISDAALIPNNRRSYLRSPTCVLNVVMLQLSGASSSWWYPAERSKLLKTVAPLMSATGSSMVGIRCFSRFTALFAPYMCTHILN